MRNAAVATTFALLLSAASAFVVASSGCLEARETLRAELEASSYEITLAVAHALKRAVDSCGHAQTDGTDPVVSAPLMRGPPAEQPPPIAIKLPGLLANACGFTSPQSVDQPDAKITGWRQVGPSSYPDYERGPASATYTPATDHTIYDGRGTIYGLHAQSDGSGIVFLFGVPITATRAHAMSGCSFSGGALCWGKGVATVVVTDLVAVRVEGLLDKCG